MGPLYLALTSKLPREARITCNPSVTAPAATRKSIQEPRRESLRNHLRAQTQTGMSLSRVMVKRFPSTIQKTALCPAQMVRRGWHQQMRLDQKMPIQSHMRMLGTKMPHALRNVRKASTASAQSQPSSSCWQRPKRPTISATGCPPSPRGCLALGRYLDMETPHYPEQGKNCENGTKFLPTWL